MRTTNASVAPTGAGSGAPVRTASRRRRGRSLVGVGIVVVVLAGGSGVAAAVPPPPPNPSDAQLNAASSAATQQAGTVAGLIKALTDAQNQLTQLQNELELKQELANKAMVDLQTAQDAAAAAQDAKTQADAKVTAAMKTIDDARTEVDQFAASSYQQGSTVGGLSAYVGAESPDDVLARAQLLDAVSASELDVLRKLDRAHTQEANAASTAKAAQQAADAAQGVATQAKATADAAKADAIAAQASQAQRTAAARVSEANAQTQLDQARTNVSGLNGQRAAFEKWVAQRRAEEAAEAERRRRAAEAAAAAARARAAAQAAAEQAAAQQAAAQQAAAQAESQAAAARASSARASAARASSDTQSAGSSGGGYSPPAPAPVQVSNNDSGGGWSPPAGDSVANVIARAESQLGVPYSWGGGNTRGATQGVRDGGVADSYGDYAKVGFDCSGLMIYAFAGVSTLPHYAGYQYNAGRKVPASQMRPGDMIFYGNAGIHHVTMYIGNGQMIEAPYSGSSVRISSVYYSDMLPYVTRLIG
ncbi:MAG: NlpC/P60 family protein [Mycobacteriaceae bacterium]